MENDNQQTSEKYLWILRHGDASFDAPADSLRELTDYGRDQARKQAAFLKDNNISFDEVWVSPYVRAQQTADEVLNLMSSNYKRTEVEYLTPDSSLKKVIKLLTESTAKNLLLVSHQPLVSRIVMDLGGKQILQPVMNTAALAHFTAEEWISGLANFHYIRQADD